MDRLILLIEDEKGIRENTQLLLELNGYRVAAAKNGKEGLEKAKDLLPDLIICDVMMPELNGYQVLESVAADEKLRGIPFLFLTARVERADFRKGMELGADDYITKPFEADELLRAIQTRLYRFELIVASMDKNTDLPAGRLALEDKITLHVRDHTVYVPVLHIAYISADRQYSNIHSANQKKYVVKKSLSTWEDILPSGLFIRIHRSVLVNSRYIEKIEKTGAGLYLLFLQGIPKPQPVSRRYYKNLRLKENGLS